MTQGLTRSSNSRANQNKLDGDWLSSCSALRGDTEWEDRTMATTLESKETTSLIASDKVDGTSVYGGDGKKIGAIERVMIDKISGKVAFAVLSFGGFLGMGESFYPLPWTALNYDTDLGGYRVNLTKDRLEHAPQYNESQGWNWNRENERRVYEYYQIQPYWE